MAKPRVIIADEDTNYIIPLQFKFVSDFFDKIDLEIISSREYFNELFSKPQNIEILIISEELYDSSLQRHNIGNVFVMSENQDEGQTGNLNVNKLFKYSSIKEIFNEVIGKSAGILDAGKVEKKETQIVLVTSASGGVGKTTIAMGVAACLTKNYKRVLYINASRLQNFQYLMDNKTAISSSEVYSKIINPTEQVYMDIKHVIRKEGFFYLPAFKAALMSIGINYSTFKRISLSAKESADYDFIVIDAENVFDENKTDLLDIADKVVVVTEQSYSSVCATNLLISNINGINSEKYMFVCNGFSKEDYNALIAPEIDNKFTVNEYVEKFDVTGNISSEELAQNNGIRKVSFLIM